MKQIRAFISLLLAVLILVSSTSFTVNMHLCMGNIHDIAVLENAKSCPMEGMSEAQDLSGPVISWKGCCENRTLSFEGHHYNLKLDDHNTISDVAISPVLLPAEFPDLAIYTAPRTSAHIYYTPPLIARNIPVFVQSFLL